MKIGIAFKASPSAFGSGRTQVVLALAEVCKLSGHEVVLIQEGSLRWWSDVESLESHYTIVAASTQQVYDLFIDIDGKVDPSVRKGSKVVVLFRSDPSFEYLEQAAYMKQDTTYSLQGVNEVWVWDLMVGAERLPLLQTMFENLPVKRIPYVWTPALLKAYCTSTKPMQTIQPTAWNVFIAEKNTTNTSSCLIPLLGATKAAAQDILLFNAEQLKTNEFFQKNLVENSVSNSQIQYAGRMRYADWLEEENCLVVSHLRHAAFRPGLLDLLWLGLPLVHNCPLFQTFGSYYSENDVEGLVKAIRTFSINAYQMSRLAQRMFVEQEWAPSKAVPQFQQILNASSSEESVLTIAFTDMWEGFDPTDNFFLDLLRSVQTKTRVKGTTSENCNLLICGPFGQTWQEERFQMKRKVYYSGEPPMQDECIDSRIDLFLTHHPVDTDRQMRLPMWALFVEWFGKEPQRSRNPNRISKDYAVSPFMGPRPEFCAFVVSNPLSQERNEAFERVNAYAPVNSGGIYRNTIGGPLAAAHAGGGGGDLVKFDFYKKHRFCICYENLVAPGYVTEKLLHAKMAGCIPLYRGSSMAAQDFNPNGYIHVQDGQDIVKLVQELEADPSRLNQMAATPALDSVRSELMQERLQTIGLRLLELATQKPQTATIRPVVPLPSQSVISKPPFFISFATEKYMSSATFAIKSLDGLRKKEPGIQLRLYTGADVSESALALKTAFPWIECKSLPAPPTTFPDMFQPNMFGWKLWLLHDACHDPELEGKSIVYSDAGATWIDIPHDMLTIIDQAGVCLVKDRTQINRHWCTQEMIQEMGISASELEEHQLIAATLGFQAMHPNAVRLLDEALKWGSKKSCLFGPHFSGIGSDEMPFGHRHDQSILSILCSRQHLPTLDLPRFLCHTSLRKTYQKGTPLYLHRGNPIVHTPALKGIDDIWVIGLDRRPDRWQSLLTAHPSLRTLANRLPGIDGKELVLTSKMAALFAKNDFQWKKSITGCALSHILAWAQLASEHPAIKNYLILEDDCRFLKQGLKIYTRFDGGIKDTHGLERKEVWLEDLEGLVARAPADADLLMLGGVLPSNMELYPQVLNSVSEEWATIHPNTFFTKGDQIPFFHFCAYSYVLTKTGAKKLMTAIQTKGVYTSIDHFLMHPTHGLKTYVLKELITTCFQAEDPVYKKAAFDEFLRVDSYDSDIWNNKECFDNGPALVPQNPSLALWPILVDVLSQAPHSIQTRNTLRQEAIAIHTPSTVYYCPDGSKKLDANLEEGWLKTLWPTIQYSSFPGVQALPSNAWLLVARPAIEFWQNVCKELSAANKPFNILHMSDEGCSDPIEFYNYPMCKKVIRNYVRPGLDEKVIVLPLGYAAQPPPCLAIPDFEKRPFVWGFHGSNWSNREELLKPLMAVEPHLCKFTAEFQGKDSTGPKEYQQMLLESQCVPIPRGNHAETFRLYEALEHGAIPLYVRLESGIDREYWAWLRSHLHLIEIESWNKVPAILELFRKNPAKAEQYRAGLLEEWAKWKGKCKTYFP